MRHQLLLGDEAAAHAAIDADIGGVFSYPGTPATEIFECVETQIAERSLSISAHWSANEKVAYEEALGMAYAGRRALVAMKHVGLNVAADPFMSSAITGVNAGLVLVVCDDPGMHSSQNEQDSRYFQEFAQLPLFEPSTQQQAYDQVVEAYEYSEKLKLPVMVRLVTRLAHSRANVHRWHGSPSRESLGDSKSQTDQAKDQATDSRLGEPCHPRTYPHPDASDWVLVPSNATRRYRHLLSLQPQLLRDAEESPHNPLRLAGKRGIIAAGIAHNYVAEALARNETDSLLRITRYPIPVALVRRLIDHCDEILIVEDGYPFIERRLTGLLGIPGKAIRGKLTGDLSLDGELTPDSVAKALGVPSSATIAPPPNLANRPPQLCKGCPHADSFRAMVEAASPWPDAYMLSDVGCYALGVAPPFRAVHTCVDMGASIAMAHGAAQTGVHPVLCTIGDSTFAHSGMTPLLGAAFANANMTVLILDNATVGMTGTQDSLACGESLLGIIRALGVHPDHLLVLDPLAKHHDKNVEIIRREIDYKGLSVIVPQRACIHVKRRTGERPKVPACNGPCAATPLTVKHSPTD